MSSSKIRYVGESDHVKINLGTTSPGTKDYNKLKNKPSINGVTLMGDISGDELSIQGPQGPKGDTGDTGPQGPKGNDWVPTEQELNGIADRVLAKIPTTEGVLYGNTSN